MNMKRSVLLAIALYLLCPFAVRAQDAMLTKEETINYLHKKVQEADNGYKFYQTQGKQTYKTPRLIKFLGKLEMSYTVVAGNQVATHVTCAFDPAHAKSIDIYNGTKDDTVNIAQVFFHGKVVKCDQYSKDRFGVLVLNSSRTYMTDFMPIPFLDAVPGNRARVEKAIKHLIDLAKAEDDPFGN
jgi:hypothetical protein